MTVRLDLGTLLVFASRLRLILLSTVEVGAEFPVFMTQVVLNFNVTVTKAKTMQIG